MEASIHRKGHPVKERVPTSTSLVPLLRAGFVAALAGMAFTELSGAGAGSNDFAIALHSEWDPTEQEDDYSLYRYHDESGDADEL